MFLEYMVMAGGMFDNLYERCGSREDLGMRKCVVKSGKGPTS